MSRIAIVGSGSVGAQLAYSLLLNPVCTEILMVDVDKDRCKGEVLDLSDASFVSDTSITVATSKEAADADLIIITAGAKQAPNEKRSELLVRNVKILNSIWKGFGERVGDDTVVMLVANPVDVMAGVFQRISGLPSNRVIGSGTYLDSMRFRQEIASQANVADSSVHAYIIGEHGDLQIPLLSSASISGIPLKHFKGPNDDVNFAKASTIARQKAYEIIALKGATFHGIGLCAKLLSESIIFDRRKVYPISVYSSEFQTYLSLPAILGRSGVQEILPLSLSDAERVSLHKAADHIRQSIDDSMPQPLASETVSAQFCSGA